MKCKQNQDTRQKIKVGLSLCMEFYRVCMGSFLMLFVPQECEHRLCTIDENKTRNDTLSTIGLISNGCTLFSFLILYIIEVRRENKCIDYLEVNRFTSVDNESVGKALQHLPQNKLHSLRVSENRYKKMGYTTTLTYIINTIVSSLIISRHYLNTSTLTVLLTNVLFMGMKVVDVFGTVYTKPNIFYSAYMKKKVQFNDVDPDVTICKNTISV